MTSKMTLSSLSNLVKLELYLLSRLYAILVLFASSDAFTGWLKL